MKHICSVAASAIVITGCLGSACAAPKPEPQKAFEQINALSADASEDASTLGEFARDLKDREWHLDGLAKVKKDVNGMQQEIRRLTAERDALSGWEAKALDQISPLLNDAANNAQMALETFNTTDPRALFASSYVADTAAISKDTGEVAALVRDYLKLAKTRETESRIERNLGS